MDDHGAKALDDWTAADVRDFLETILPGHPCVDCFTYTSGYVLASLEKEDLRRQARDDEAANVIWAQLQNWRGRSSTSRPAMAAMGATSRGLGVAAKESTARSLDQVTLYVKTRQDNALEVEISLECMVSYLKDLIASKEGTPQDVQRLAWQGVTMQDDRTLRSYGVRHGGTVLLVPQLRDHGTQLPRTSAPRGPLMVPGGAAWSPKATEGRPYLPVLCSDVSRPYPVSLEFASAADIQAFTTAAQQGESPVLEIEMNRSDRQPVEIPVRLDAATGAVSLGSSGNVLAPSSEYKAFLHFGGRGGHIEVSVQTGAAVPCAREAAVR